MIYPAESGNSFRHWLIDNYSDETMNNSEAGWLNAMRQLATSQPSTFFIADKTTIQNHLILLMKALLANPPALKNQTVVVLQSSVSEVERLKKQIFEPENPSANLLVTLTPACDTNLYLQRSKNLQKQPFLVFATPDRYLVHLKTKNIEPETISLMIVCFPENLIDAGFLSPLRSINALSSPQTLWLTLTSRS